MLFWFTLFDDVLNTCLDFPSEIHFGSEKTEHTNAPIKLPVERYYVVLEHFDIANNHWMEAIASQYIWYIFIC